MLKEEIIDMISRLNDKNVNKLKNKLLKYVELLILNLDDEDINLTNEQIISINEIIEERKKFRYENEICTDLILFNEFKKCFDKFIDEINNQGYICDALEIMQDVLRGIGGLSRGTKLCVLNKRKDYLVSNDYLRDLQREFYKLLKQKCTQGIYEEENTIIGLIYSIRFELQGKCEEYGRLVLSLLRNKDDNLITIKDFEKGNSKQEIKSMLDSKYTLEIQKRIYMWDKLTLGLKNHYSLEKLYEHNNK